MSTFFSGALKNLAPYTPGEQPQDQQYVKLNTNESPYPPSAGVITALNAKEASDLRLYSDPECKELKRPWQTITRWSRRTSMWATAPTRH